MLFKETRERWQPFEINKEDAQAFAKRFSIDPLITKVCLSRGLDTEEKLKKFLHPSSKLITNYDQISDADNLKLALDRLKQAIENDELIVINGDPDADGITGTSIFVSSLRNLGAEVEYDFPARAREGHGLQPRIIDETLEKGGKLIMTVDCGSKDIPATKYAQENGIDVIICDHHILGNDYHPAYAIINPYRIKELTPYKYLSGAGTAFKLILALYDHLDVKMEKEFMDYLLALLTLGTISDRMSFLEPMNRILIKEGIKAINSTKMEGLKALKEISAEGYRDIKSRDISRTLVPRLNAPGRIGDPEEGIPDANIVVDLLLLGLGKKNARKAAKVAQKFADVYTLETQMKQKHIGLEEASIVDDVNEKRKYITNKIEDEIEELIESQVNVAEDRIVIIKGKNWNPGVIGIDTDRLKDRFLRPAMILTEYSGNPYIRGSVRSIPSIHVYNAIDEVGQEFEEKNGRMLYRTAVKTDSGTKEINAFGGHSQACGFTVHKEDLETFLKMIREKMNTIPDEQYDFHYEILDTLTFDQLGAKLVNKLDQLSPYGQQFDYPIFYLKNINIGKIRTFGNRYQENRTPHIDCIISDAESNSQAPNAQFKGVGFGLYDKYLEFQQNGADSNTRFDIIFMMERHKRSRKNGKVREEIRLNILDIRLAGREDNLD